MCFFKWCINICFQLNVKKYNVYILFDSIASVSTLPRYKMKKASYLNTQLANYQQRREFNK